jgi:hypothetical protein
MLASGSRDAESEEEMSDDPDYDSALAAAK